MKKLLFLLLPLFAFGQTDSVNVRYIESIKDYRELNLKNQDIDNFIKCTDTFAPEYSKLLQLDDLSNTTVQKALLKDYVGGCNSIIKNETGSGLVLFTSKDDIEKYIILQERMLKAYASNKIIDYWLAEDEKSSIARNLHIENNLKRLNITQSEWDKMSDSDRSLLYKTFR